jgi:DNA-binding MarR family transcriptional regulator
MINLPKKFESYLYDNLGINVIATKWPEEKLLPLFLRELYAVYECSLLGSPYLLMVVRNEEEQTPATIRKHLGLVEEKSGREVIYLHPSIPAYNRKRLIEQKVPFVVPGNQMYLPPLGIDLREHIRKLRSSRRNKFSPSTQAVVLYALYHDTQNGVTPSALAEQLSYSPMTLTRAFDEIAAAGLGDVVMQGRERILRFVLNKRSLWEKALEYLRSPVKKRTFVKVQQNHFQGLKAGLSALSRFSMLAEPLTPVYAVNTDHWKALQQSEGLVERALPVDPGSVEVEIWSYAPELFSENDVVDRLSLFLSLQDNQDERVESALDDLMEGFKW